MSDQILTPAELIQRIRKAVEIQKASPELNIIIRMSFREFERVLSKLYEEYDEFSIEVKLDQVEITIIPN